MPYLFTLISWSIINFSYLTNSSWKMLIRFLPEFATHRSNIHVLFISSERFIQNMSLSLVFCSCECHKWFLISWRRRPNFFQFYCLLCFKVLSKRFHKVCILVLLRSNLKDIIKIFDFFFGFWFSHISWVH